MRAYHIDRGSLLQEGQIINLQKFNDFGEYQNHFDLLFPEGVSRHGNGHFGGFFNSNNASYEDIQSTIIEVVFEYERQIYFPDKPSRSQAFFALEKQEDIKCWGNILSGYNYKIWEIEFEHSNFFKADGSLLKGILLKERRFSFLAISKYAHMYWSQCSNSDKSKIQWELLIKPPVKIVRQVQ